MRSGAVTEGDAQEERPTEEREADSKSVGRLQGPTLRALRSRLPNVRARHSQSREPRSYRLANSIRLPWGVGLAGFLVLSVAIGALVGRSDQTAIPVPPTLLDYQEGIARDAAQSVRRSLNEGVQDLDEFTRVIGAAGVAAPGVVDAPLREFSIAHKRYLSAYALDRSGGLVSSVGARPTPQALAAARSSLAGIRPRSAPVRPGLRDAQRAGPSSGPLIAEFAAVRAPGAQVASVLGHYDPEFFRFPLEGARPGDAWIVNARGEIVGALAGAPRFTSLPRRELREAAAQAATGNTGARSAGGSLDRQELIGHAPVSGDGPAGRLGWSVVTTRAVKSFELPQTEARRQAILSGALLAFLSLFIFGWLYIVVIAPISALQQEAERLAYGDLSKNVEVVRYDEIGLTARALERMRIILIRRRPKPARRPED